MSKRAVLFAGGNLYKMPKIKAGDLIVAIDSGLDHCQKHNVLPSFAIGDFDSASPGALAWAKAKQIPLLTYPAAKDQTDTQLAVEHVLSSGALEILIWGGVGTRLDHSLANVQLLLFIAQRGAQGIVSDGQQEIYLLQDQLTLEPQDGMCFSILPLSLELEGLSISGARYPLLGVHIDLGDTRTISNEFLEEPVELSLENGIALVFIYPKDL